MMYPMVMMLVIMTMQKLLPIVSCQSCDKDVSNDDDVDYFDYVEVVTYWKLLEL